jgi:hypothetical protein
MIKVFPPSDLEINCQESPVFIFDPSKPFAEWYSCRASTLCRLRITFPGLIRFSSIRIREGSKLTLKEVDGLNLNKGPALMAMNGWSARVNVTMSVSPEGVSEGVSWRTVILEIADWGNSEQ